MKPPVVIVETPMNDSVKLDIIQIESNYYHGIFEERTIYHIFKDSSLIGKKKWRAIYANSKRFIAKADTLEELVGKLKQRFFI